MTTASKSPGTGSPVSTTVNAFASSRTGVVSLAPIVSAACTAMPSIAAASNGGDEVFAQTGSAVTRPTAWSSGSRTVSTRSGQPVSAHASSQAAKASAAGRSWMNGAARAIADIVALAYAHRSADLLRCTLVPHYCGGLDRFIDFLRHQRTRVSVAHPPAPRHAWCYCGSALASAAG